MAQSLNDRWDKVRKIWEIIDGLRGEPGCPWDKKQTPESVQTYLLEEAHEAASAVRTGDVAEAAEELGDLLFMVFFLVHLYEEQGEFALEDVCDHICDKMVRRHPHVFGDLTVSSTQEVKDNWEKIKAGEKAAAGKPRSEIPESLPSLIRTHRMIARAASKGGEQSWNDTAARAEEFAHNSARLRTLLLEGNKVEPELFGTMLLQLANLARIKGHRPEDCLHDVLRTMNATGKL